MGNITNSVAKIRKWGSERKLGKLTKHLKKLIERLAKKGEITPPLLNFVKDNIQDDEKPNFWRIVLQRTDISAYDAYDISLAAIDEESKTKAQEKFLNEADMEELLDMLERTDKEYQEKIFDEICKRIKYRRLRKGAAWKLLGKIIGSRYLPDDFRKKSCELLLWLDPSDTILKELIDLPVSQYDPLLLMLQREIEAFIRGRKRGKDFNNSLFNEIRTTRQGIAKLKSGQ